MVEIVAATACGVTALVLAAWNWLQVQQVERARRQRSMTEADLLQLPLLEGVHDDDAAALATRDSMLLSAGVSVASSLNDAGADCGAASCGGGKAAPARERLETCPMSPLSPRAAAPFAFVGPAPAVPVC